MEWMIFPFRTDAAKEFMAMARHADRVAPCGMNCGTCSSGSGS